MHAGAMHRRLYDPIVRGQLTLERTPVVQAFASNPSCSQGTIAEHFIAHPATLRSPL